MGITFQRALRMLVVPLLALPFAVPIGTASSQEAGPTVEWISVDSGDVGGRELPATSADGRYVVFVGRSSADMGVWVRDRVAGETVRLTSGSHFNPDISPDGTMVAYAQFGGAGQGVYVLAWQEAGATPELVSLADDGGTPGVPVDFPALSEDGRYVAFQAYTGILDDDVLPGPQGGGPSKVYVRDRVTADTEMVSVTSDGQVVNGNANRPAITPDGRYVVFSSDASVLAGGGEAVAAVDEDEEEEETAVHVYRHDRQTGTTEMASVASDGTPGDGSSATAYGPTVSDDGRLVAFESDATNLVADDLNANTDAFVRDVDAGETVRVSVDEAGDEVTLVNPELTPAEAVVTAAPEEGESIDASSNAGAGPAISGDGTRVAFESDGALTSDDLNTPDPVETYQVTTTAGSWTVPVYTTDVYVRDLTEATVLRASAATGEGVEATGLRTDGVDSTAPANNGTDATVNVDGRLVVFVGNGNLNGALPPPEDESEEVVPAAEPTEEPTEDPVLLWEPEVWGRWDPTINAAPVAGDDHGTVSHGRSRQLDVLANDVDANLDALTITEVTAPAHGTATIGGSGATVTYLPEDLYVGDDTFTYTVDDGYGGTDTATVTMAVTNTDPVARDDAATAVSGEPELVAVLGNDTDADGDTLAITSVGTPTGGTVAIVDDAIQYVPDDEFTGVDAFDYSITDGIASDTATVTVTVSATGVGGEDIAVVRTFGETRVDTAVALSSYAYPDGSNVAFLARADLYPDALAGAPLARAHDAPILLTASDELEDVVADELDRLGATQVFLLGGEEALTPAVELAVEAGGADTTRIAGPTRFETAARIADRVVTMTGSDHAYVTEGADVDPMRGWPDALAVSALAALEGDPILLVTTENVPAATAQSIADLALTSVTVIGGPVAVADATAATLDGLVGDLDRLYGADRWATSAAIADATLAAGATAARTWVVTGLNWPDALVAGPLVAREGGVLLLVHGVDLVQSPATAAWLTAHAGEIATVRIVGGPVAISADVATAIEGLLP